MVKMDIKLKKCTTPVGRVSFPNIDKARSYKPGQEAKFSVTFLFPTKLGVDPKLDKINGGKLPDLTAVKRAATNACIEQWGKDKTKWPKGLDWPFRDGNEKKDLKGYKDTITIKGGAKEINRPGLVDANRQKILDGSEFYAGCYGRMTVIAHAGGEGKDAYCAFSLQNVQKVADGEKFTGKPDAADDFEDDLEVSNLSDDEGETSEDPSSYESNDEDNEEVDLGF